MWNWSNNDATISALMVLERTLLLGLDEINIPNFSFIVLAETDNDKHPLSVFFSRLFQKFLYFFFQNLSTFETFLQPSTFFPHFMFKRWQTNNMKSEKENVFVPESFNKVWSLL
jgi:hypothetical protein